MKKILRIALGTSLIMAGTGLVFFSGYILWREPSWVMIIVFIFIFGFGFALTKLGYAIARGSDVRDALVFLFFLGNRAK